MEVEGGEEAKDGTETQVAAEPEVAVVETEPPLVEAKTPVVELEAGSEAKVVEVVGEQTKTNEVEGEQTKAVEVEVEQTKTVEVEVEQTKTVEVEGEEAKTVAIECEETKDGTTARTVEMPAKPGKGNDVSVDDAVDNFFEGLDEEAFLASLQVVSSWDEGKLDESALSRFSSFLPRNKMGARRDPLKTKRDIERDKVNKNKETLIKKMETGLLPPGTEMDVVSKDTVGKDTAATAKDTVTKDTVGKDTSRSGRRRSRSGERSGRRSPYSKRSSNSRDYHKGTRPHYKIRSPIRDALRNLSPVNRYRRDDIRYKRRERDDSHDRYKKKRTRSPSRDSSPKYRKKPGKAKDDFLTYLSKNNLLLESDTAPEFSALVTPSGVPPAPPAPSMSVYTDLPYVPDPGYTGPPSILGMPPAIIPGGAVPTMVPPPVQVEVPPPVVQPTEYYQPPSLYGNGFSKANLYNPATAIANQNTPTPPPINKNLRTPVLTNVIGKPQKKKNKVVVKCENVVKQLGQLRTPTLIAINTTEDKQQRDCSYTGALNTNVSFVSPLNRDSSSLYSLTSTGDKNRMIVPTILYTLRSDEFDLGTNNVELLERKDVSTQTIGNCCDRCQLKEETTKEHKQVGTRFEILKRSVHSQVREEDLVSSKIIFTPNQMKPEPQQPISLTHLTPAQILVAELAARAKSMQRSAVDHYRQSGGNFSENRPAPLYRDSRSPPGRRQRDRHFSPDEGMSRGSTFSDSLRKFRNTWRKH